MSPEEMINGLINMTNTLYDLMQNDEAFDDSDMEILNENNNHVDVTFQGHHLSFIFESTGEEERPDSSHLTRPGSIHGPPNPLGSHSPSSPPLDTPFTDNSVRSWPVFPLPATPSTDTDDEDYFVVSEPSSGPYSLFPAATPLPPPGFKQVRFKFTADQILFQDRVHPKLRESVVVGEIRDEDESDRSKSVKFKLTQKQIQRQHATHPRLRESEVIEVIEFCVSLSLSKVAVLKRIAMHVFRRVKNQETTTTTPNPVFKVGITQH